MTGEPLTPAEQRRFDKGKELAPQMLEQLIDDANDDMAVVVFALCCALRICADTQDAVDLRTFIAMAANLVEEPP